MDIPRSFLEAATDLPLGIVRPGAGAGGAPRLGAGAVPAELTRRLDAGVGGARGA